MAQETTPIILHKRSDPDDRIVVEITERRITARTEPRPILDRQVQDETEIREHFTGLLYRLLPSDYILPVEHALNDVEGGPRFLEHYGDGNRYYYRGLQNEVEYIVQCDEPDNWPKNQQLIAASFSGLMSGMETVNAQAAQIIQRSLDLPASPSLRLNAVQVELLSRQESNGMHLADRLQFCREQYSEATRIEVVANSYPQDKEAQNRIDEILLSPNKPDAFLKTGFPVRTITLYQDGETGPLRQRAPFAAMLGRVWLNPATKFIRNSVGFGHPLSRRDASRFLKRNALILPDALLEFYTQCNGLFFEWFPKTKLNAPNSSGTLWSRAEIQPLQTMVSESEIHLESANLNAGQRRQFLVLDIINNDAVELACLRVQDGVAEDRITLISLDDGIRPTQLTVAQYLQATLLNMGLYDWREAALEPHSAKITQYEEEMATLFPGFKLHVPVVSPPE